MLELPGLTNTGDLRADVDTIRRYLARLIPQLEMELANAEQDDYAEAYNALSQGVGSANKMSTAGALAAHQLDYANPHRVTAAQLGLDLDKLVSITFVNAGAVFKVGAKRGIQVNIQTMRVTVDTWTQHGGVAYADVDLGQWDAVLPVPYYIHVLADGGVNRDYWAGPLTGTGDRKDIGTVRIYHECGVDVREGATNEGDYTDERIIPLTILGLGVFGYGE